MNITGIDVVRSKNGFSANIEIDGEFVICLDIDGEFSIPKGGEAHCLNQQKQDEARESLSVDVLVSDLSIPTSVKGLVDMGAKVYDI